MVTREIARRVVEKDKENVALFKKRYKFDDEEDVQRELQDTSSLHSARGEPRVQAK